MKKKYSYSCSLLKNRCLGVFLVCFFSTRVLFAGIDLEKEVSDSLLAIKYNQEGIAAWKLGDFDMALNYFKKLNYLREHQYGENSSKLAGTLINIGIQNKNIGNYDAAIQNYLQAEHLYLSQPDENPRLGFVYVNLGIIYKIKGDFLKSYEYNRNALRLMQKDSKRLSTSIDITRFNVAESLFLLKRNNEAIALCEEYMNKGDDEIKSYYTSLLARIYAELEQYDLSKKYYRQTLILLSNVTGKESYDLGLEYTDYIKFLLSIKEFDEIPHYNELSERIISKYFTTESTQYAAVMLNYADYLSLRYSAASYLSDFNLKKQEDLKKALDYYQKAIVAATSGFNNYSPQTNPVPGMAISELQLLEIMKKKSACFSALGDLKLNMNKASDAIGYYRGGLEAIQVAIELVHQIRTGFETEESRLFLTDNQQATFIEAVNLCYKLYSQTNDIQYALKGFELTEKSKSASFLAAVKDSRAKQFGGIPDSLINKEEVLKINISNYKQMLYEEKQQDKPDSIKVTLYNSKIFDYSEKYSQLVKFLEDSYPKYYSFKYADEVISLEEIRKRIKGQEAIVEYLIDSPDDDNSTGKMFRFLITNKQFGFYKTNIDKDFSSKIEYLYAFLTNSNYQYTGKKDYKEYVRSAFGLYNDLLGNFKQELEGKKLIIIPDDKLSYIPFDALLYEQPDTSRMSFMNLPYLIRRHSVSYTYSSTLLFDYFNQERTARKGLLAFAPSYENDDRDYSAVAEYRSGLLPLQAVDKEVEYISKFVNGDVFKDSKAQETKFKELAKNYDVLHLAMHTIMNDTLPMYSKLAFSKPLKGSLDDGWLNTSEIYNMQLNARMAVLSACNTGSGKMQKGEGVMSLARGFLYAGCPSIIMTLWEVEDESGANIMRDFYRFLSAGKDKDEALRLAKLAHIDQADPLKAHPHFWLGYVAVGNTAPLYKGRDFYFIGLIVLIVIGIMMDLYRRRRKNKAKKSA